MSGGLDVPRSTCHRARHLASTAMEEGIRRTQQQSVPPQVPQVGRAAGETGASPSIRRPMLVASVVDMVVDMVVEAKKPSRGICSGLPRVCCLHDDLRTQLAAAERPARMCTNRAE
jgi:hypothetical protein